MSAGDEVCFTFSFHCLLHVAVCGAFFPVVNRIKTSSRATMLTDSMFDEERAEKLDSNEMINLFKADPPCEAAI